MPSEQEMRAAIAARDQTYDDRFFYAVVTTGVFCRPSCAARPARPENLRFFRDPDSALAAGFRPCKRCRPTDTEPGLTQLVGVARFIEAHAEERLTLDGLAKQVALSPSRFQRVFKAAFGVSPKVYQDAVRMKRFKAALQEGDDITGAIFSAGFGSISRVYGERVRNIGMTPKAYRAGGAGETIAYAWRNTALGTALMGATERGVCFVQFGKDLESLLKQLRGEFPNAELSASDAQEAPELDAWVEALDAHLAACGETQAAFERRCIPPEPRRFAALGVAFRSKYTRYSSLTRLVSRAPPRSRRSPGFHHRLLGQGAPRPDLPLDLRGTAFQMKVWRFLLSVREGEVISYGELATQIEQPKAARAVASACAANRIAVLVPCHRVLRGDGGLGGYRWGLKRKRALLDAERPGKAASP